MPFMKYAAARVVHPQITKTEWSNIRVAAKQTSKSSQDLSGNLIEKASEFFGKPFNPQDYLLTHCFPAGHLVLMADGTEKPIEQITINDSVISHTGRIHPVTQVMQREVNEDLVTIKSASLPEVACTGDHPFYIIPEQDSWCKVYPSYIGQVKCTFGGKQLCGKHKCLTNGAAPHWVKAQDLRAGDRTYTPTLNETLVPEGLNPNRMRLLGYYTAEGRVDKDPAGRLYSIRFALHDEELPTLGSEIASLMLLEFGISTHSIIKNKKRVAEEGDRGVIIAFHSHQHAPWFLKHAGIGSRTKRLSADVILAPIAWQRQLMGAWFNGDGCNDADNKSCWSGLRLSTTSDDLASQALLILDRMGIYARLQRAISPERSIRGRVIAASEGWHVCVPRSYAPLLDGVTKWNLTGNPVKCLSTKRRYRYAASVVSEIEEIGRRHFQGTVYNFSVAGDESYIVNRQAVHNCTIVASVDVYAPVGMKTGSVLEDGFRVDRKFPEFRVTPETDQYINNNLDFWPRQVLLASYATFIGGHNFVEHIQMEEQSRGRIIDAVARDVGNSVYIDILIATDRKHKDLVSAIKNGKMGSLSMGCFLPGTQVSMADGSRIAIEEVKPGDMVLTHKGRAREVLNKQIRGGLWNTRKIQVSGVSSIIEATDNHPFLVSRQLDADQWLRADELQIGDLVCLLSSIGVGSKAPIISIEEATYDGWVHNMEVAEDHTYVVEGVAVSNCTVDGTQCTKCGHWSADETELCAHVKYSKGNRFYDDQGVSHRIAEKCGDVSIGPTGGVHFIEASWVGTPAFTGAVLRNVLEFTPEISKKAQKVLASPPPQWSENSLLKAASNGGTLLTRNFGPTFQSIHLGSGTEFLAGWADEDPAADAEGDGGEAEAAPEPPKTPFKEVEDEVYTQVMDRVRSRIKKDLTDQSTEKTLNQSDSAMQPNDSLIKAAAARTYRAGLTVLVKTASDDATLIDRVASFNQLTGIDIPVPIYRASLKVGRHDQYSSLQAFKNACYLALGHEPTLAESKTLLRLGRLLSRRASEKSSELTGSRQRSVK